MKLSNCFVNGSLDILEAVSGRDLGEALLFCTRAFTHTRAQYSKVDIFDRFS